MTFFPVLAPQWILLYITLSASQFVVVQLLSSVRLFPTPRTEACLSLTIFEVFPSSCPLHWWCHSAISFWHSLLLLPSILPSMRDFSNESVVCIRWWKYWSFSLSISLSNEYSGLPHRVMEIKAKINKWDLIKLKRFCTMKETISKVKRQPSEWEKIIVNEITDKELISEVYSSSCNSLWEKQTIQLKSGQKT